MLLSLLLIPMVGVLAILIYKNTGSKVIQIKQDKQDGQDGRISDSSAVNREQNEKTLKSIALAVSSLNLFISLVLFILFDFSTNQFQFIQEYHEIGYFGLYLGVDGLSIYFVLLTTLIMPISLVSN